jgi:hypothetical protein
VWGAWSSILRVPPTMQGLSQGGKGPTLPRLFQRAQTQVGKRPRREALRRPHPPRMDQRRVTGLGVNPSRMEDQFSIDREGREATGADLDHHPQLQYRHPPHKRSRQILRRENIQSKSNSLNTRYTSSNVNNRYTQYSQEIHNTSEPRNAARSTGQPAGRGAHKHSFGQFKTSGRSTDFLPTDKTHSHAQTDKPYGMSGGAGSIAPHKGDRSFGERVIHTSVLHSNSEKNPTSQSADRRKIVGIGQQRNLSPSHGSDSTHKKSSRQSLSRSVRNQEGKAKPSWNPQEGTQEAARQAHRRKGENVLQP